MSINRDSRGLTKFQVTDSIKASYLLVSVLPSVAVSGVSFGSTLAGFCLSLKKISSHA